ncbi:MAG: ATPase domain-containing protein [Planctomycetota bacterium]
MERTLQTNVAQAFWCSLENRGAKFEPAKYPSSDRGAVGGIAWFDLLLEGGINLPASAGKPVVMLITGTPGSGKTTLAVELCYRIARSGKVKSAVKTYSLFFSTDTETDRVIESAKAFDFKDAEDCILPFSNRSPDISSMTVCGREQFEKWTSSESLLDGLIDIMQGLLGKILGVPQSSMASSRPMIQPIPYGTSEALAVIAVDNLNNVPQEKQERFLKRIVEAVPQAQLLICVAEEHPRHTLRPWEYAADIWVKLGSSLVQDYQIRTIEIVKARYQNTVYGAHQLKIYPTQQTPSMKDISSAGIMRRAHPYRTEGGIFIYPSIHYHLSRYKRRGPTPEGSPSETHVDTLDQMLGGGLPKGRCTAFIGDRGGHKSHLGYLHLLHRVVKKNEAGLVISLRDDEQLTRRAMARILKQEFEEFSNLTEDALNEQLDNWERKDQLEILYFHPGYITPNEFFHRVFMSIYRMKVSSISSITAMFNSIDQLAARFPLCANEDIFVPGIIEALSGEGVTSVFIAVDESGQPMEQYGLLPMADLILGFRRQRLAFVDYFEHLNRQWKLLEAKGVSMDRIQRVQKHNEGKDVDEVVVQVLRFAGGQRAGKRGILELVDEPDDTLYNKAGLYFTEMS